MCYTLLFCIITGSSVSATSALNGDVWLLSIGVGKYHESLGRLHYATGDAKAIDDQFANLGVPSAQRLVLLDPTFHEFKKIDEFLKKIPATGRLLFFYAGHGFECKEGAFLFPADASWEDKEGMKNVVPVSVLRDAVAQCLATSKVMLLDACHSGSLRSIVRRRPIDPARWEGMVVVSSCRANQSSVECERLKHGVFTFFVLKTLRECRGALTVDQLFAAVESTVPDYAHRVHGREQTPVRTVFAGANPILVRRLADGPIAPTTIGDLRLEGQLVGQAPNFAVMGPIADHTTQLRAGRNLLFRVGLKQKQYVYAFLVGSSGKRSVVLNGAFTNAWEFPCHVDGAPGVEFFFVGSTAEPLAIDRLEVFGKTIRPVALGNDQQFAQGASTDIAVAKDLIAGFNSQLEAPVSEYDTIFHSWAWIAFRHP